MPDTYWKRRHPNWWTPPSRCPMDQRHLRPNLRISFSNEQSLKSRFV